MNIIFIRKLPEDSVMRKYAINSGTVQFLLLTINHGIAIHKL